MATVTLYRKDGKTLSPLAYYGQREEFEAALPGMIGPLVDLIDYKRYASGNGTDDFYECIRIRRKLADGEIVNVTYRVEGL